MATAFSRMLLKKEFTYKFNIKMMDEYVKQLCKLNSLYKVSSYVSDFVHHTRRMEDEESAYVPKHTEKNYRKEW